MNRNPVFFILFGLIVNVMTSGPLFAGRNDSITERRITIAGVGDIMLGSSYPSAALLHPRNDPGYLLGTLADTLAAADIAFGNLEGAFLNKGLPVKRCKDSTICYLFRMPERYAAGLTRAGFDMLSLANNHFGDFGQPARSRTKTILDSLGIAYAGLTEHPWSIVMKDSILYGFCAFAPNSGTVNLNDLDNAKSIVAMLADTCDIVIVSFHGGAEGAQYQHVPKTTETFHGENRGDVHKFAHTLIDAGADVVFGHGPHVTRAVEVYRDRFIAYSMGNFCTYGRISITGPNGIAPLIIVTTDTTGRFLAGKIIPVFQTKAEGTRIDPEKRVIKKIQDLTAMDFPDAVINISDEGVISYK